MFHKNYAILISVRMGNIEILLLSRADLWGAVWGLKHPLQNFTMSKLGGF